MTKIERLRLNELSKTVFGASSKWQTLLNKGQLVKNEKGKVFTQYYTLEEITKVMEEKAAKPSMKEITDLISDVVNKKTEDASVV